MGDDKIGRSFSIKKRLAFGAFLVCFTIAINFCTNLILLKPFFRLPTIYFPTESMKPMILNLSTPRSDVYEIKGDIRIHGITSTIFIASSNPNLTSWTIKPYSQKMNTTKYKQVTTFTIKTQPSHTIPPCDRTIKNIPAIVFSDKGHTGNLFHDFSDVLFPLYATSRPFNRTAMFLVTNYSSPWLSKYRKVLNQLSKYEIYDIDKESQVLCFARMIVGLKTPKGFFIHPSDTVEFPTEDFLKLLQRAFSLQRGSIHEPRGRRKRPRMLIIWREKTRRLMNMEEVTNMARNLGFEVVVKGQFSNLSLDAKTVNSVDVLVGVHGAALTNLIFLPENAIVVQIVPFGLDEESMVCFEWPAVSMKLRYLKYMVSLNESSILGKYPNDIEIYREPQAIKKKRGFGYFRAVYIENQDVKLDVERFRKTLVTALELVTT